MKRTLFLAALVLPVATLLIAPMAVGEDAQEHAFVGSKNCKKCHLKEYKSWEQTTMAQSFELLKPGVRAEAKTAAGVDPDKDYTTDETCLPCHTTGYGKETGFVSIDETPELAGVGCEWCHGAGGTYTQDHLMSLKNKEYAKAEVVAAGMVAEVGPDQCTPCHNSESPFVADDFVFDYETQKAVEGALHEQYPLKYEH